METQLAAVERSFAHVPKSRIRVFATGSGAAPLIEPLGAKFVQEVNAVTIAVEGVTSTAGRAPSNAPPRRGLAWDGGEGSAWGCPFIGHAGTLLPGFVPEGGDFGAWRCRPGGDAKLQRPCRWRAQFGLAMKGVSRIDRANHPRLPR